MASRSRSKSYSSLEKDEFSPEEVVATEPQTNYNINTDVQLRAIYPSLIKLPGPITGKLYVWDGAGSVVSVHEEDAPALLDKRVGNRGCCGHNRNGNRLFEIVF